MIFIDTGAFLARYLKRDQHHRNAVRAWKRLEREAAVTSNFVLDETITLLGRWAGYGFAAERGRALLTSAHLDVLLPDADAELDAIDFFGKFADQRVSFTDCVSFALMRRHGVDRAFTFDRHFETAGFRRWPG